MAKVRQVVKPERRIKAWSYSRWRDYEECPRRAAAKILDKFKEPQGPALARGDTIHREIEEYLLSTGRRKVPDSAYKLRREYEALRKRRPRVELEVAFNSAWKRVDWFASDAWVRIKIDALVEPTEKEPTVEIVDHKSGKLKSHGEYDLQLDLYMLTGLLEYESAAEGQAAFYFVDHGAVVTPEHGGIPREKVEEQKTLWAQRTRAMLSDTRFDPRPGPQCTWCGLQKAKGGPCEY